VGRAIAAAVVFFFVVFPFLRGQEVQIITAVVGLMVAVFMWQATTALIGHSKLMLNLPTVIASDLMQPASAMASAATVADVRLRRAQRGGQVILVDPRGMPVGVVDEAALSRVDPAHAAQVPALAVSRALGEGAVVAEDSDGRELIDYLASVPTAEYAVISHRGVVVGLLHQADIVNAVTGRRK
jgi:predicted transcriptional regulator